MSEKERAGTLKDQLVAGKALFEPEEMHQWLTGGIKAESIMAIRTVALMISRRPV